MSNSLNDAKVEVTQQRTIKMHPRLLWDVIHRQAGTLSKAVLEGAMNSVDAGATFCNIKMDRDSFSIVDDGKGFVSDEEIENFFETFGHPHEEGDATYGRFRMGRGQMMSFGKNEWRTNYYKMSVDLKPQKDELGKDYALGYGFTKTRDRAAGCNIHVDLYEKLTPSALDSALREVSEYVKYVNIPVKLNGKVVSNDPAKEKWDEITPDAYIKRKAGGTLDVYNQGVLVTKLSSYAHGVSGIVVSKEAIDVNFARNAVQSTCPRWKRIVRVMAADAMEQVKRNQPLNDSQRDYFARSVASGEVALADIKDSRIVTNVTNSHHAVSIFERLNTFQYKVSIASKGDRVAEMAHTRRLGFMVSAECAARFNVETPQELVTVIKDIYERNRLTAPKMIPVDLAEFAKVISSSHEPIADKELNKAERLAIKAIREGSKILYHRGYWNDRSRGSERFLKGTNYGARRISVGASDTAQAWTDGTNNIWIERRQLRKIKDGYPGMVNLSGLLLHEYLHNDSSTDTHDHGVEFYNRFHDLALDTTVVTDCADAMMKTVLRTLRNEDKYITKQYTQFEDNIAEAAEMGFGEYDKALGEEPETAEVPSDEEAAAEIEPQALAARTAPAVVEKAAKTKRPVAEPDNQMTLRF